MIGEKLSPILIEIENALWEFEAEVGKQPEFPIEAFRAATKIFMTAMLDKIWNLQNDENMDFETRCCMAQKCGEDIRAIIKTYTDIDSTTLYD